MATLFTFWHAAAIALLVLILRTALLRRRRRQLPPGPAGWPIIDNALDMPLVHAWKTFAKWGEQYGKLVSVSLLGQTIIVINSYKDAYELLEKRSAMYSDRPRMVMAGEVVGWDRMILVLFRYGHQFRECRRLMGSVMGSKKSIEAYVPIFEEQSAKLLGRVLREPTSDLSMQIRKMTGAISLMIAYGYEPQEDNDPLIQMADDATNHIAEVAQPGAYLVDVLPFLKYVPSWMPGTAWKRKGVIYRENLARMSNVPHQLVKDQMAAGTANPSFTSKLLSSNPSPEEELMIKISSSSIYVGGADTTVAMEMAFVLAMGLYPDVQKKAQAELDAVVGDDRLPTYADLAQMPYLNALYLEVLRWHQVSPLGVPRRVLEDDMYEGYYFPKDSTLIVNQWYMLHDPEIYKAPFTFSPERFLKGPNDKEPEMDPRNVAFGFGRRICPGIYFAEFSIRMVVAMMLSAINISRPINEDGIPITPETVEHTGGMICHPSPFTCTIRPRSEKAKALVLTTMQDSE